jgi:fatty-acyl-CoA synthase
VLLVADSVRRHSRRSPDKVAILLGDASVTWSELEQNVNRCARTLVDAGVRRGDYVAVLARNRIEYIFLYFATARLGAVLCPMNYWLRPHEVAAMMGSITPKLLIVAGEFAAVLPAILSESAGTQAILLDQPEGDEVDEDDLWPARAAATSTAPSDFEKAEENDTHLVTFTSGSTGRPKAVARSQRESVLNAMNAALALGLDEQDRTIVFFPFINVGAWEAVLHKYLFVGASAVIMPRFDADRILDAIEAHSVTTIFANPAMFRLLLAEQQAAPRNLTTIRLAYIGGMAPDERVSSGICQTFDIPRTMLYHTYGLTEAGPWVSLLRPEDAEGRIESIGKAITGVEIALLLDSGEFSHTGEATGEIVIGGELLMAGYLNNPEANAATFKDGWLLTGDIARRDAEGFYFIVDRKKDVIRPGGQNVYPADVETALRTHADVYDVAVVGVPDPLMSEAVCAAVVAEKSVPESSYDSFASELREYARTNLAGYKVPKHIVFVDELPRTASEKVSKPELRERVIALLGDLTG